MKGSEWLQKVTENNGNISIWPAIQDKNTTNVIVLEPNIRCPCNNRVGFMYQCKHEYLVDTKFNIDNMIIDGTTIIYFMKYTAYPFILQQI